MMILALSAESFIMKWVVAPLFVICCLVLVLIILIQKGKGGGLSAAFGGAGAGGVLGAKTGDFLTWVTIVLVSIFLGLAVLLAKFYKPPAPGALIPQATAPASSTTGAGDNTGSAGGSGEANTPGT